MHPPLRSPRRVRLFFLAPGAMRYGCRVAFTMAVLSMAVLYTPVVHLLDGKGNWAVITGVVMSERTVGLVFQKGINRVVGTVAGCLAVVLSLYFLDLVHWAGGQSCEVYVIVLLVTVVSGVVYHGKSQKWFPNYDYAFFVTAMTYDYLLLTSYKYHNNDEDAYLTLYRILAICVAAVVVVLVTVFVFPDYAGDYLLQVLHCCLQAGVVGERSFLLFFSSPPPLSQSKTESVCPREGKMPGASPQSRDASGWGKSGMGIGITTGLPTARDF